MFEQFMQVMAQFNELAKANPMLATILGAGGATAIVMSLRQIPKKLFDFLFGQITTELTMNNAGWEGGGDQFRSFMLWYIKHSWSKWSRSLSLETQYQYRGDPLVEIGAGFGTHFFTYKGRLFWFQKMRLDSSGTSMEKMEITIKGFTRNRALFEQMVQEFRYRMKTNTITVTAWDHDKWGEPVAITKRALETVIMERGLKASLVDDIDRFYESREWYEQRGLPYKRCVLFYGPPGTGKTSIIKALASHYGRNVFTLNLSAISDNMLAKAMASVPEGSILLIEDFDTNKTVMSRAPTPALEPVKSADSGAPAPAEPAAPPVFTALSLSGLLNALDGIVPLDGSLIFLTTNHLEKIDGALLRNGRVDKRIMIPFLKDPEVRDYIELMFPGTVVSEDIRFQPIAGCDLMSHFSDYRDDVEQFIAVIPKDYDVVVGLDRALNSARRPGVLNERIG
jgi:hypothetical protein